MLSIYTQAIPSGYSFYKKLTTQENQITVGTTNSSGFPVLVKITDPDLRSVNNGGRVRSANGYDIVFTAGDKNTLIPFQVEEYDATTGEYVAWVKLPVLSATVNTDFYMFFGNASIATTLGSKTTWDANYKAVYHLNSDVADWTSNAASLTNSGTTNFSPGIAADGQRVGSGTYLGRINASGLQITGDLTIETWINFNSLISGSNENLIISSSSGGSGSNFNTNYSLSVVGSGSGTGTFVFRWQYSNNSDEIVNSTVPFTSLAGTGWRNIVVTRDNSTKQVRFYVDGIQLGAPVTYVNSATDGSSNSFLIGKNLADASRTIDAAMDEVRISNLVRGPEWIQAAYMSYRPASTFLIYSQTFSVSAKNFCFCNVGMPGYTSLGVFNTHTYFISTQKETWQNADSIASLLGGHLVSINSVAENLFLSTNVLDRFWIGLTDSVTEGTFVWTSGETVSFTNWSVLQPNNSGNSDYALFNTSVLSFWDDLPDSPQLFVIEFDCTAPTAVLVTANAGVDQTICGNTTSMAATFSPASATGQWAVYSGAATFSNSNSATTVVSGFSSGSNFLIWKVSLGSCTAVYDTVKILTDTVLPKIVCPTNVFATNTSGQCSGIGAWTLPSITDNCPGAVLTQISGLSNGASFPVGTSSVSYRVTDNSGNTANCSFFVTVSDDEAPKIICSGDLSFPNDPGLCGSFVTGIAPLTTADNCSGFTVTYTISGATILSGNDDASGSFFNIGSSKLIYTITDATGNQTSCSFNITILDTEIPVYSTCPTNITVGTNPGLCSAIVSWPAPVASDNCPGLTITQSTGPSSGSPLPVGTTTIKYIATDASLNSTVCLFDITVEDTIAPVFITCPSNITLPSTAAMCGSVVIWTDPTFDDNCPGAILTQVSGLPNGSVFPVGTSTVVFKVTDVANLSRFCSFTITITDLIPPVFSSCPLDIFVNATAGNCGAIVNWTSPTATDNCALASLFQTSGLPSGSFFPVGTTNISFIARDAASNISTCNFNVIVSDTEPPVISCPANLSAVNDSGLCSAIVTGISPLSSFDNCGTSTLSYTITGATTATGGNDASGTAFNIGNSLVTYMLKDNVGNTSTCSFNVTVNPVVTFSDAGPSQLICDTFTTMAANTPVAALGTWSLISGSGVIVSPNSPNSLITGMTAGTSLFRWTVENSSCASSFSDVSITVDAKPSTAIAGPKQIICSNSGNLSANTPVVGQGNWTLISGLGSITNPISATSAVSALGLGNNVFRWTITNGVCPPSFDDDTIFVVAIPTLANAGADQTSLCGVTSTSLAANTPTVGTGAWSIVSGAGGSFVAATNPTTTFNGVIGNSYVLRWTISNAPCAASSDDVLITFNANPTVANAGADQTSLCGVTSTALAANTPTVGTGAWSIVSGVGGSFVAPSNPTTTFNGVIGSSYVLRWTISNAPCAANSDDVLITFNANPTVANAGADQTSLCGVTSTSLAANTPTVGTGAWSIVSGVGGSFVAPSNPTTTFNGVIGNSYVLRWTISNAPCTASSDDVLITFNANPTAANAGADQTSLCGVTSTSLSANTPSVGNGSWSIVSGVGGSFFAPSNPTTTFNGVIGSSYVLRWTISNAPCAANSDDVLIAFNANPTAANAGADQTSLCGVTSTSLSANTPTVGTGAWSIVSGVGGSFVASSNPTTTFNGVIGSSYVLRWTISNAPCAANSDDVLITFNANPTVANAGADQTSLCGVTSTSLSANTPTVGTGAWSIVSGVGGSFVAPSNPTTTFNGVVGNSYVLRWSISNAPCAANSDDVLITFNANPTAANAGADQTSLCGVTSTALAANAPTVGTGAWSIVSGVGGSFVASTNPTTTFNGVIGSSYVLRWTISNAPCTASSDDVLITFNANPTVANAGADQTSLCGVTSSALAANAPTVGTGAWSIVSGVGGSFVASTNPTTTFNGVVGNSYVLRWTISNAPCTTSSDDVLITFNSNPTAANAGADQTSLCGFTSTALAANTPTVGTGSWSIVSGVGGSFVAATNPTTTFNGVVGNSYVLRWSISNAPCAANSDDVLITFNANPTAANAGADQTSLCGVTSTTLAANAPTVGIGAWSIVSGAGGSFVASTNSTTTFNGVIGSTYVLRWTISNAPCAANSDDVLITFNANPTVANAGADQTSLCGVTSTSLSANTPTIGNGSWSIVSGVGGSFVAATNPTTTFNGVIGSSYVLRWSISNAPCTASSDDVLITFNANPTAANAGADQTSLCGVTSTALAANAPTVGTGAWSIVSGVGGSFVAPSNPTTTFNGVIGSSYVLRWTISNAPCTASSDDVLITFNVNPTAANAGADQTSLCGVTSTSLSANTPTVGTGAWSIVSGVGGSFVAPSNPTTTFNGVVGNSYVLRWSISNAPCTASSDDVLITFNANPTVANAGADQTSLCGVTSTSLAANTPTVGTGAWSIVSGAGGSFVAATNPTTTFNGVIGSSYVLRWTISNAPCTASSDDVLITFNANPTVANAGADQTSSLTCGLTSVTLSGNTPISGSGLWSIISGGAGSFSNASQSNTIFSAAPGILFTLKWTISNGCGVSVDTVLVKLNANPSIALAGADQPLACDATSTFLAANSPIFGVGTWSIVSGLGGSVQSPNSPISSFIGTLSNAANVTYMLRWTITNAPCVSSSDDMVITFPRTANAADAGTDIVACGTNSTTLNAGTPGAAHTGVWTIVSGTPIGTFSNQTSRNSTFTGSVGSVYVLRWTITRTATGCTSFDEVSVSFPSNPVTANAGSDQLGICGTNSTTLSANAAGSGTGQWSIISGLGGSFSNSNDPAALFTGGVGLAYTLRWTISTSLCGASFDEVAIAFNASSSPANAGNDQISLCGINSTLLTANTPLSGVGSWTILSGVGGIVNSVNNPQSLFTGILGNTYSLEWSIQNSPCIVSKDTVVITFNGLPTASVAGPNQTICGNSVVLSANTPLFGNGLWSLISGSAVFANPTSPVSAVSGLGLGTNTLRWEISTPNCGSSFSELTITVTSIPAVANAGPDQTSLCGVSSTTLAANTPTIGFATWTIVSGSGGTFQNINNPTSSFSGLLGNSYVLRWTISNPPCADSFDDVIVTFNDLPSIAQAGVDQTICAATTSLAATTPLVGIGGWQVLSGASTVINPANPTSAVSGLSLGANQFVWTVSNGSCAPNTDTVTVFVDEAPSIAQAGVDQTICASTTSLAATAPIVGTGSWQVIVGSSTIANPVNPTSSVSGLSLGSNQFVWTVSNGSCAPSSDTVTVFVDTPPTIAQAGVDQTICATTTSLAATTPLVGFGSWQVLSGASTVTNPANPTSAVSGLSLGANQFVWTVSNGSCAPSSDTVTVIVDTFASIAQAGVDQTICASTTSLAATAPIVGTGSWQVLVGASTIANPANPTSSVSGLSLGANQFVWTVSNGTCAPSSDTVTVFVDIPPSIAQAGVDQTICASTTSLAATTPLIGIGTWQVLSGASTVTNPANPTSAVSGLSLGSNQFVWTVSNGSCAPSSDTVTVIVDTFASAAQAGADQTICASTTNLAATAPIVGTGSWQVLVGASTIANPVNPTSSVSGLSLGSNQFVWTVSNGTCAPSSDTVTVFVDTPPSIAQAGVDQTICATTTSLAATTPLVGFGSWQVLSGASTVTNPANPTSAVSGLSLGANQFVWTVSNGSCAPSSDTVTVIVDTFVSAAQAGVDQTICASTTSLAATAPLVGTGSWLVLVGASTIANPVNPTSSVSGLSLGTNQFVWTVSNGTCAPSSDTVTIFVDTPPSIAQAGVNQTICASTTSLAATTPLVGIGSWQVLSGTSTVTNPANPTSAVSGLSLGSNQFVWTVSNGSCAPSSDTVTVIVDTFASAAQAGVDQTICASTTSLVATTPLVGTGSWQVLVGASTIANPANPTSSVSGLSLGTNQFVWTVSNGTCAPSSDTVTVFVDTPPSIAQAGVDQTICASTTSLAATTPLVGIGSWQVFSGASTVTNPANPTSAVSGLSLGANQFVWTVSNGSCAPSSDTVTVIVDTFASTAQAGVDQTICASTTSLAATAPLVGTGSWQVLVGASTIANPVNPTSSVSGLSLGTNQFVWTVSNGTCAPSSDTVTVFVDTPPSIAQAGVNQTICASTTSLAATTPLVGIGSWQVLSGTSTVTNPTNPTSAVSGLSLGSNQFVWTVSNGSCAPSSDTVTVFVDTFASTAQAGVDQTICASTTSLAATAPLVGTGSWQVLVGASTIANPVNPTSSVSGLSLGTNQFVWTVSNGTCAPSSDTVAVFVDTPASFAQAGVDQTICASNTSLAATTPQVGIGSWQVLSGTSTVTNPANPTSAVSGLSLGSNQFVWTVSNGSCAPSSDTVTVFVDEAPSIAFAGANQTICSSTTNLAATIPLVGSGVWTIVSGTGVFANFGDAATSVSGIINDTNIYRWTVGNGICPSVFSDVMVVVASNPPVADAGPNDTICGNSTTLNGNISLIGIGTWTLVSGSGNFVNANAATTLVNNLGLGDNIFRWTLDNPPCTPTFDDVTIQVTSIPAIADAGGDTSICSVDSIVLYGNNPISQSKKWTILSGGGGSFSVGLDTLANSVFHGIPDSTYVLRWTLSNPPCADSFDDVVITFLRAPSTSNAGSNQIGASTCGLTTLSLAANIPNSGVGTWSVQSGAGGTIQSTSSPNSLFTGVSGSTYLLTWTIANTCGSSQSDVLIAFNQNPDTALAGNDSTICASAIQLGANIPSFGTGFWKSITGTGIFSDTLLPNSTISNLSAGIHTLVWEITSPVCGSSYDTLTIQVDSLPAVLFAGNDQTICDSTSTVALNATAASIGNSFWSLISGSGTFQNPTQFNSTVSQLSNGINLLAWNLSNGVCPTITDTLTVTVDTPPSAANAGNNRIVCTNFVVLKADSIVSGTGLWSQTLGTGANIAQPTNDTTLVNQLQLGLNAFTWTVSNGVCPSNSDTVYIDVNQASSAAVAGADTTICESTDSISIHALAPVIGIGSWKVLIGPSIISDSLQATTYIKGLQKGLNKIVWTVRNGLCSDFDVVNILVDSLPTPANAGLVPAVCETSSSVLLAANQAITGIGQWTSASGVPVFADTTLATSTVSNLQIGANELFWTISNGACLGVSSSVTVQVDQLPDTAKAGIDIRSCEGFSQLTLAADSPLIGIGYWTKLSGPLDVLDTANAHTALTGSATAPYSSSFSWTTSNGVCPLMVDTVSVLIDAFPSSSFAGINDTICSTNIQLNASVPLVGLGQWSSLAGTIQFVDTNLATSSASGLSVGSNTLYWTVSNGVCADSVSSVNIFVDEAPSAALAGADISVCENTSGIVLNASVPTTGSGNWAVLSGTFQLVNSTQANSALQNITPGNSVFVWTVINGVCPTTSDTVSVTVSAIPSNAIVGANQTLCENATLVNVSATAPTSGTGSWSVILGGGSILSPTSATTQVTFNPGINSYAYTVTSGTCPSSVDTAFVTIDSVSAPAIAGNDLTICENATAISLNATFVNYGIAQWTSLTPGISIVNPAQNNTAISGVVLGSNQLVWTSTNGVCPANSDTVEIIVSSLPSTAIAGTNQNWCDTITQIQLQGNIPQVGSGVWIPVSGSGTISNPNSANTTVSGLQVGSAVFEWVISSGACTASRDSVSITINASPTLSNAGINQNYCISSNAILLNGNVPTIGTGTWSLLSGNATIDNVSQANSGIQVSDSGNYIFNWTITNGVCQSTSSTEIHIDALPSSANAGTDITANTPAVFLNAETPQIGTGTWLLFQGTGTINDINNPSTQVSGLTQGTTVLSWTVSNGACAYSADEITISYLDLAIPNAISPNNDGINDAFVIPGLEYYSNVTFTLFNSWGTIVYESNDYKNDFAGLTNSGQKLIDDTYYFVLQISSDLEYKGYLIIKK
ncbi:MAG: DUF2341 domain-containing protein [Bacteroidetes bacterium]|nr:DUF2341 domain-containing protein [Bacteroidota bacterium]